jgi:SynChlorMet cassette protein ScmC
MHPGDPRAPQAERDGLSPDGLLRTHAMFAASLWARRMEWHGALLVHGALIVHNGVGIILAAPAGRGKSTAAARLHPPWEAWSDDACLVLPAQDGRFRAHPWPTWSRIIAGDDSGRVHTDASVPLRAVTVLVRSDAASLERLDGPTCAAALSNAAEQLVSTVPGRPLSQAARQARTRRFDSACSVARSIPGYALGVGLRDRYWELLESLTQETGDGRD